MTPKPDETDEPDPGKSAPKAESKKVYTAKMTLTALILQTFILGVMIAISWLYYTVHGLCWPVPTTAQVAAHDFMGLQQIAQWESCALMPTSAPATNGESLTPAPDDKNDKPAPTLIAVIIEVLTFSTIGVLARSEYFLTQKVIRHEPFETLEVVARLVGEYAMGIAVASAVIIFLRSTQVTIAQIDLSLSKANLEATVALAFILGFYHEGTRKLLANLWERIAGKSEGKEKEEKSEG